MSGRQYWVGVAARDHVLVGIAGGFCMFAHGNGTAARRLSPGDRFAYYAPMSGIRSGEPVRRFVATGEVLEGGPEERVMTPETTGWWRPARYVQTREADVYPLLGQLSFVRDPANWGMAFRRSLFSVSDADFSIIAAATGADFQRQNQ